MAFHSVLKASKSGLNCLSPCFRSISWECSSNVFQKKHRCFGSPAVSILDEQSIFASLQLKQAHVPPVGAPRIPDVPVLDPIFLTPANHLHIMVNVIEGGVAVVFPDSRPIPASNQIQLKKVFCLLVGAISCGL